MFSRIRLLFFFLLFLGINSWSSFSCDFSQLISNSDVPELYQDEIKDALGVLKEHGLKFSKIRNIQTGMNPTIKAQIEGLDEVVIIKVKSKKSPKNFGREIAVMRYLDDKEGRFSSLHPIMDALPSDSRIVVMKKKIGHDLSELIRAYEHHPIKFSIADFFKIYLNILKEVTFLHATGVVHLDLKPTNLIIKSTMSEVTIIDFGTSTIKSDFMYSRASDAITRTFASPEYLIYVDQVRAYGKVRGAQFPRDDDIGTWSDIYSLGVILELLINNLAHRVHRIGNSSDKEVFDQFKSLLDPYVRLMKRKDLTYAPKILDALRGEKNRIFLKSRKELSVSEIHSALMSDSRILKLLDL